ncbi:hypothetical protein TrCOL_g2981 [Triparma columacea]|uniref:Uncharacterized protein n=1 Tax=Triparma columacea TaxID=722753 RepID=A0A9W7G069_9STRA|nr:hypothetical protein TrCOL_g2981 [Triparma columacea]
MKCNASLPDPSFQQLGGHLSADDDAEGEGSMVVVFVLEGDVRAQGVEYEGPPISDGEADEGSMPEFVDVSGTPEGIGVWKTFSRRQNDVPRPSPKCKSGKPTPSKKLMSSTFSSSQRQINCSPTSSPTSKSPRSPYPRSRLLKKIKTPLTPDDKRELRLARKREKDRQRRAIESFYEKGLAAALGKVRGGDGEKMRGGVSDSQAVVGCKASLSPPSPEKEPEVLSVDDYYHMMLHQRIS